MIFLKKRGGGLSVLFASEEEKAAYEEFARTYREWERSLWYPPQGGWRVQ